MDVKQCKVASISLRIIRLIGGIYVGESTYIPSPLVWSGLKTFDDVVDVVTRKIRPQDVITYHKRGALLAKPTAEILTH